MSDKILIRDGFIAPTTLAEGELAIDEVRRILYVKTHKGAVPVPLDRMALEAADENASDEVYVWRSTLIAERVPLSAGGGATARDDRVWRIPGLAPMTVGSAFAPLQSLFEITYPIVIHTLRFRALSGTGTLSIAIYTWDGELGDQLYSHSVAVTGAGQVHFASTISLDPGRYAITVNGDTGISYETVSGLLPWHETQQVHAIYMSGSNVP